MVSRHDRALSGLAEGSRVAGYVLEEQIGAGGMAVVFRARDERLHRQVALKVLAPALAADEAFRHRFIRESRAAAVVDDPHIIPVFEAGEADGTLFIAMRYVPDGDVRSLVHRVGPLPAGRAAAIISPVASALDSAHAAGLVHRDVKPANMLLDAQPGRPDHVYLSDFGLSKSPMSSLGVTGSGQFLGTPDYAAPEQIQGNQIDGRADQYSLACAAFELLCGEIPFPRDQAMAMIWAHMAEPPPPLTSRRPGLPAAVDAVLARALAKAPADRYASCREFADALRSALGVEPYHSDSAAAPDGELTDRSVQHKARHARAATQAPQRISANATTAGPPPAGPTPELPPAAGENPPPVVLHREDTDHPNSGPTRRNLLLGAAACSAAAGLGVLAWDLATHHGTAAPHTTSHIARQHRRRPAATGPGTVMWQADVPFRPSAHWVNLALGGDVLCVQGATEMFALSTSDGTQLWKFNDGNTGGINGVAVGQDAVYFSNITNPPGLPKIYALQSGTGKVIWTTLLSGDGVALADGAVYVGAEYINTVNLYALSAADGAQIWEIPVDVFSTPVVKNGVVYTLAGLNPPYMFYALQASNGKQLWSSPVPWFDGEIVTDGNTVCALFSGTATSGGALWAWRASDGKELWKSDANNGFFSAAIAGDVVYAVNDDGELLALNAGDGTKIWGYPASPSAVPAISNGLVYAIGAGGGLVALHASNGTPVWHSSIYSTAGPVVGADAVYASDNSRVYALRT